MSIDFDSEFGRKALQMIQTGYVAWFTTVGADLTPQPRPVWFIWSAGTFLIYSKPDARKVRHVIERPRVAVHFNTDETGDQDVVIMTGQAIVDHGIPAAHDMPAYIEKYRAGIEALGMTPAEFSRAYSAPIRVTPTNLRGW